MHALVAADTSLSERLVNRHAVGVGITRCGLLAINEARLCLCVWRLAAGTSPSHRLGNRHAAEVVITRCGLLAIDESQLCLHGSKANVLSIDMRPRWALLGAAYWLSMRHDCACVCGDSLQARVKSQLLVNRHAAAVGITQCGLLAIDEAWLIGSNARHLMLGVLGGCLACAAGAFVRKTRIIMYNRLPFAPRTSCAGRTKSRSCVPRLLRFVVRCHGPCVTARTLGFDSSLGDQNFTSENL
ncbi:hypothetical protein HAX54_047795 [Datura stramonium]|uniref:Uncharacterized protein n=1 Tax=Datura stramonium TaxID=4076 RepID=A0ABS8RSF7_DATST|nr:hypothetical protein [Datura stramonium]